MPNNHLIPAVLAETAKKAQARINRLSSLGDILHLDIMDGRLVSDKSFGQDALTRLKLPKKVGLHLMVKNPEQWVSVCKLKNIKRLIIHVESKITSNLAASLNKYFDLVIAIKPGTSIEKLTPYKNHTKTFMVMTVHPGRQGRKFLSKQLSIIRRLRKKYPKHNIMVDGGMNEVTIPKAKKAGADDFILGSVLKNSNNPKTTYKNLTKIYRSTKRG